MSDALAVSFFPLSIEYGLRLTAPPPDLVAVKSTFLWKRMLSLAIVSFETVSVFDQARLFAISACLLPLNFVENPPSMSPK